jgi:hypothetical protein
METKLENRAFDDQGNLMESRATDEQFRNATDTKGHYENGTSGYPVWIDDSSTPTSAKVMLAKVTPTTVTTKFTKREQLIERIRVNHEKLRAADRTSTEYANLKQEADLLAQVYASDIAKERAKRNK